MTALILFAVSWVTLSIVIGSLMIGGAQRRSRRAGRRP